VKRSFSGAHPFRPVHLRAVLLNDDQLVDLVQLIDGEICPRCLGFLPEEFPAGSRVTDCRCIPVCSDCGSDEPWSLIHPADWPVDSVEDGVFAWKGDATAVGEVQAPGDSGWLKYGYDDRPDREEQAGRRG
jgi:hypothetical protein